jgi:hypothetical protein
LLLNSKIEEYTRLIKSKIDSIDKQTHRQHF